MARQSKQDLEDFYSTSDPWGYQDNSDDIVRKQIILDALTPFAPFKRALDIGCGEGFITKDLPAKVIEGIEISDTASERLPSNVKRVKEPKGKYDLIICTGMLYEQYDYEQFIKWIEEHANGIILTCNIKGWEHNPLPSGAMIHLYEFPYRTYTQSLKVYQCPLPSFTE